MLEEDKSEKWEMRNETWEMRGLVVTWSNGMGHILVQMHMQAGLASGRFKGHIWENEES